MFLWRSVQEAALRRAFLQPELEPANGLGAPERREVPSAAPVRAALAAPAPSRRIADR
ncbi:MAG: hypothetical protein H6923_01150 [Alphaproteobacteria bacterium]|nr:hypothetical protein [Alphaproteobacteria bacterium]